jgi:hypothetical protein
MNEKCEPITLLMECLDDLPEDFRDLPMFVNLLDPHDEGADVNRHTPLPLVAVEAHDLSGRVHLYVNGLRDVPLDPSAALTFRHCLDKITHLHKKCAGYVPTLSELAYKGQVIGIQHHIYIVEMQLTVSEESDSVILEVRD